MPAMPPNPPLPPLSAIALPQHKAAKALGVSDRTIRNWERRGLIQGRRVGGKLRMYDVEALRALATANG